MSHLSATSGAIVRSVVLMALLIKLSGLNYFASLCVHECLYEASLNRVGNGSGLPPTKVFVLSALEYRQLDWKEQNEFELDGVKYDVLKEETLPEGGARLHCYSDDLETSLQKSLEEEEGEEGTERKKNEKEEYLSSALISQNRIFLALEPPFFPNWEFRPCPLFEASLPLDPPEIN